MFLRCGDYLKFLMGLRKISTKICQIHVFSLWRLTWVFDGTWKNFHKKVCPVTRFFAVETILSFFAVETNLSFWWDLEKFSQKSVPSHTFLRCGDYLKFLMGLGKFRQKDVTSYTFFFAAETILSFWLGDKKLWKISHKNLVPKSPVTRFFSLWKLTWVFDGTGKNFHKKVCPVICFFAVETISSFWWGLEKLPQKFVPRYTFFRCGD